MDNNIIIIFINKLTKILPFNWHFLNNIKKVRAHKIRRDGNDTLLNIFATIGFSAFVVIKNNSSLKAT